MELIKEKKVYSAYTVKDGGVLEAVYKMSFGNNVGVALNSELSLETLLEKNYGNIVLEVENASEIKLDNVRLYKRSVISLNGEEYKYPIMELRKSDKESNTDLSFVKEIIILDNVTVIESGVFDGLTNAVIKTSYKEKPEGWEEGWNGDCEVIWGVEFEGR
jgi:hypothetical protein